MPGAILHDAHHPATLYPPRKDAAMPILLPTFRPSSHLRTIAVATLIIILTTGNALSAGKPQSGTKQANQQAALLEAEIARLPVQRPGTPDMYILGIAGDADEDVFRNEVLYLRQLSAKRWNADGRMISLINHPASAKGDAPMPLATRQSIGQSLDALGKVLDPEEDVLFLYLSSHGLDDNSVYLHTGPGQEEYLAPNELARMLDNAGIGNAVVVVSACYSGAFIQALRSPRHTVITAARRDRPSFGCGNTDSATWFGRAFLVEALNTTTDLTQAFDLAATTVRRREREEGERPSVPQFESGKQVEQVLARWRAGLSETAPVPYPFVHPVHSDSSNNASNHK